MSTDRELLELAAKAAGIQIKWHRWPSTARETAYVPNGNVSEQHGAGYSPWSPLENDGDALRLAVKLKLQITPGTYNKDEFTAFHAGHGEAHEFAHFQQDEFATTRRAIVRAAAAIGKAMP